MKFKEIKRGQYKGMFLNENNDLYTKEQAVVRGYKQPKLKLHKSKQRSK